MKLRTSAWREVVAYRELLWMLIWRDVRVRYKHTALGAAWAILPPLLTMAVFSLVFQRTLGLETQTLTGQSRIPYPLFAMVGLVAWSFFANSLNGAVTSLVGNRPLLTKIHFPREVFPIAAVGSGLVDFVVSCLAFALLAVVYHATTPWRFELQSTLVLLPIVAMVQLVWICGLSMLLAMGNLFYRDVGFIVRAALPLWMFVTNVAYELRPSGTIAGLLVAANPMTAIIRAYRDCLFEGRAPDPIGFGCAAVLGVATLALAARWFHRLEFRFAEIV